MTPIDRLRETVEGSLPESLLRQRTAEGWRLTAVEWSRPGEGAGAAELGELLQNIPYGLQIAPDCRHLIENQSEKQAMELMLDLIADDKPISKIAAALNERGFRTRSGAEWTRSMVFSLLPRLIEAAPDIRWREPVRV